MFLPCCRPNEKAKQNKTTRTEPCLFTKIWGMHIVDAKEIFEEWKKEIRTQSWLGPRRKPKQSSRIQIPSRALRWMGDENSILGLDFAYNQENLK